MNLYVDIATLILKMKNKMEEGSYEKMWCRGASYNWRSYDEGAKGLATAVRTPNGEIEVKVKRTTPITKKYKILNIPIIRGAATLIDSLIIGINTLNYSASFFEEDEEESKFDAWLKK